ncbi:MAG: CDP-diacylglycerol--glycerol-3-phosphate 3-phosphatidyltransferase [Phycisphaerales bacterium]|nr:MAG: CDP-diacylglycerol--glycerol-3-phosphate 3-phosphatidyltransferase [Phycisphaerales bacterium]
MPDAAAQPAAPATGWRAHTPNALTGLRLILTGAVVALLAVATLEPIADASPALADRLAHAWDRHALVLLAAFFFIVAAITDALDGYLARKWHAVSVFGRVMDPLADKLLVLGTFVMLAGPAFEGLGLEAWMVVVILGRELLVTSLRGVYEAMGVDFSASLSGKLKMIAQSAAAPLLLIIAAAWTPTPESPSLAGAILAWATTLITLASAWPYLAKAVRAARTHPTTKARP